MTISSGSAAQFVPDYWRWFTGADLLARSTAVVLLDTHSLGRIIGRSVSKIEEWRHDDQHREDFKRAMIRLDRVESYAGALTEDLVAESRTTGVIRTYRDDDDAAAAGELVPLDEIRGAAGAAGGAPAAALHRECAGRAAAENPDAALTVAGLQDTGVGASAALRAEVLVQMAMLGLNMKDAAGVIGVPTRALQNWIAGTLRADGTPREVFHPERLARFDALGQAFDEHQAVLDAHPLRAQGYVPVARDMEALQEIDPGTVLPLAAHRAAAGEILAADHDLRAQWRGERWTAQMRAERRAAE